MKIGLYLQSSDKPHQTVEIFNKAMDQVKHSEIELLVFPEFCYVPFWNKIYKTDLMVNKKIWMGDIYNLSKELNIPVVISCQDDKETIFSIYANAGARSDETTDAMYIKHTATGISAFDYPDYNTQLIESNYTIIKYKNYRIGMTICYDCNHAMFSRMYGIQGVDILVNSTGGKVVYDKWYRYNKARSIENDCFSFVTMGGPQEGKTSHVYGFTPKGKSLSYENISTDKPGNNVMGSVYVYDTELDDGMYQTDISINQYPTVNKRQHFYIRVGGMKEIIDSSHRIDDSIFDYRAIPNTHVIICDIKEDMILKPEEVLKLLYNDKLSLIDNKRYILYVHYNHVSTDYFNDVLSTILKVRATENYVAVILESDNINTCIQSGSIKNAQVVRSVDGKYGLDLIRTKGPEVVWKGKPVWKEGYKRLIDKACMNT